MIVDVSGIEAFLPGSQIDVHPIRDYNMFVGKTMEFKKMVKITRSSAMWSFHTKHSSKQSSKHNARKLSHTEKGQILEGVVKNITSYGIVWTGGVDGLN